MTQAPPEIHNLAVLRASVEGVHLGTYLGSWGALKHWIESTRRLGWIDAGGKPSKSGAAIANSLELTNCGDGRAYMWPDASGLAAKAQAQAFESSPGEAPQQRY